MAPCYDSQQSKSHIEQQATSHQLSINRAAGVAGVPGIAGIAGLYRSINYPHMRRAIHSIHHDDDHIRKIHEAAVNKVDQDTGVHRPNVLKHLHLQSLRAGVLQSNPLRLLIRTPVP